MTQRFSAAIVVYRPNISLLAQTVTSATKAVAYAKQEGAIGHAQLLMVSNDEAGIGGDLGSVIDYSGAAMSFDAVETIGGHGNVGFGKAHNIALDKVSSDVHLILNPDVEVSERAIAEGVGFLSKHSDVVLLSPKATWPDGEEQPLCKRFPTVLDLAVRGFGPARIKGWFSDRLARYEMRDLVRDRPNVNIDIVSGCFMLARTGALQRVNGFSPEFFLYFEDFDLSLRLREVGRLAYVPTVQIVHAGGRSSKKGWRHLAMFARSAGVFFSRHGWRLY